MRPVLSLTGVAVVGAPLASRSSGLTVPSPLASSGSFCVALVGSRVFDPLNFVESHALINDALKSTAPIAAPRSVDGPESDRRQWGRGLSGVMFHLPDRVENHNSEATIGRIGCRARTLTERF